MTVRLLSAAFAASALLVSGTAFAHVGAGPHLHGFEAGFAHPFTGLDHLLAMSGLGLWAASYRGAVRWSLPALFVAGMVAGLGLAGAGVALPGVEIGVAASVIAIGALIALGTRLPAAIAGAIAFGAALFHGHAHGTELAGPAAAAGIIAATAVLHLAGLGLGVVAAQPRFTRALRAAGTLMAAAGVGLLAAG